jgi:hypothetical protein
MIIASSLLQVVKKCRQACPSCLLMRFSQGSILESLVKIKKIKINKVIQLLLKPCTFYTRTAIPYRESTGFLQGSPCVVILPLHALAVYRV